MAIVFVMLSRQELPSQDCFPWTCQMADATGQIALSVSIIKGRAQHAVNENLLYIALFARSANRWGTGLASTL